MAYLIAERWQPNEVSGPPHPNPLPEGEGALSGAGILPAISLSLWEGRVRDRELQPLSRTGEDLMSLDDLSDTDIEELWLD